MGIKCHLEKVKIMFIIFVHSTVKYCIKETGFLLQILDCNF